MAVLFGELREDGMVIVCSTAHYDENNNIASLDKKSPGYKEIYEGGYEFDVMPNPPEAEPGISYNLLFDPKTKEFYWESVERELTAEEKIRADIDEIKSRIDTAEENIGTISVASQITVKPSPIINKEL